MLGNVIYVNSIGTLTGKIILLSAELLKTNAIYACAEMDSGVCFNTCPASLTPYGNVLRDSKYAKSYRNVHLNNAHKCEIAPSSPSSIAPCLFFREIETDQKAWIL